MNDFRRGLDSELASMIDCDDPETSAVIKRLAEKRKTEQLLTAEIRNESLDFLTAKPDKLKAILMKFPDYCRTCRESGAPRAAEILEAIVDRYTRHDFNIDCDTLTFIGIHLKKNGYKQEAIRCFNRAEAIISE
ncbi:MAG: hypothetical protein FWC27_15480 [Firmicutes bacterium]|nr:hypothetical protein [Bacillota bacterium]